MEMGNEAGLLSRPKGRGFRPEDPMKPAVGYLCDHCGERVHASAQDPVAMTTRGVYHTNRCLQEAYVLAERTKDEVKDAKRKRRSEAAKARWAKRHAADKENHDSP